METNLVKEKIKNGQPVIGTFLSIDSVGVAEVLGSVGFDYLLVDLEHGLMGIETTGAMMTMMKSKQTVPLARVEKNDHATIGKALDAGAYGVMVPMINTAKEAEKAVSACKYPLTGIRGVGPGHMSLFGVNLKEYLDKANENVAVILQIEHIEAVNNIEEIVKVPGIDVLFIGPSDLASSMGLIGQNQHEDVQRAIDKVADCCKAHHIAVGIYCFSPENAVHRIEQGYQFITYGLDSSFLANAAKDSLAVIRG